MITPDEVCTIIDLAVAEWHKVAEEHGIKSCNCYRDDFGKAIIAHFGFTDDEMVATWDRKR